MARFFLVMVDRASQSSKPGAAGAVAAGLLAALLVAAALGLLEGLRLALGGYDVSPSEGGKLVAAYAAVALPPGLVGVLAWLGLRRARRRLAGLASAADSPLVFLPVWVGTLFAAFFANKLLLPELLSPASLAGNVGLGLGAVAILFLLQRSSLLRRVCAAVLAAAVLGLAAGQWLVTRGNRQAGVQESAARAAGARLPTLLMVVIDTLRADHLGAYGYDRPTSPEIDALSRQSIVFERAYSTSNWTRPSVASLLTSTRPSRHGVTDFQYAVPASLRLLTESLREAGYRTAIFSGNPNLEPEDGYHRGTDTFVSYSQRGILGRSLLFLSLKGDFPVIERTTRKLLGESEIPGYEPRRMTDAALAWLDQTRGPRFAYLHYVGPHDPYLPPPALLREVGGGEVDESVAVPPKGWSGARAISSAARRRMVAQYDAEILWHDREIGRLFRRVERMAQQGDLVLVVTSDHGEGFGENGVWAHGEGMFDEIVRIPLILWCSRGCGESRRSTSLVSLLDVAPTLLELAAIEVPGTFEGESLLSRPPAQGSPEIAIVSENPKSGERAIRTPDWSFAQRSVSGELREWLWPTGKGPVRGADEAPGPGERGAIADLRARLLDHRERAEVRKELAIDPERLEELRALGYLD